MTTLLKSCHVSNLDYGFKIIKQSFYLTVCYIFGIFHSVTESVHDTCYDVQYVYERVFFFKFFAHVGIVFHVLCIYEVRCTVPDPMLAVCDKINCLFS